MSNRTLPLAPPYPVYDSTPLFGGSLPSIEEIGPPDTRPSSMNSAYNVYGAAWGRNLAGLGQDSMTADEGIRDYPNELNVLAEADDVQGNGVFDPAGSHGNIHPDEGVFADHESLPGYIVRDRFYRPSTVIDGTTGEAVLFVPSGAVAIDQAQEDAYAATQLLYEIPLPEEPHGLPADQSTWIPRDYAFPIGGLGAAEDARPNVSRLVIALAIVGVAVGITAATLMPVKRGRR